MKTFSKVAAPVSAHFICPWNYRPFIFFHILIKKTLCVLPVPFLIFKKVTVCLPWERHVHPGLGLSWAKGSSSSFNKVLLCHSQTGPVSGSSIFCFHSVTVIKRMFSKLPRYLKLNCKFTEVPASQFTWGTLLKIFTHLFCKMMIFHCIKVIDQHVSNCLLI